MVYQPLSVKKAFYKWFVMADGQLIRTTIEKILRNSKMSESKAAYIIH